MTLQECYAALEGDYKDVLGRLGSERFVQKFVLKFLNDTSFEVLCKAMEAGVQEEAFRAAHTIKGMCQNLSFTKLESSDSRMTEALRSGDMAGAKELLPEVRADYERTVQAIRAYQAEL